MRPVIVAVMLSLLAFQQPAQAYIDPATGSLILQGFVAFFVGAAFTLKNFFRARIKPVLDWLLRRPPAAPAPDDPAAAKKD